MKKKQDCKRIMEIFYEEIKRREGKKNKDEVLKYHVKKIEKIRNLDDKERQEFREELLESLEYLSSNSGYLIPKKEYYKN